MKKIDELILVMKQNWGKPAYGQNNGIPVPLICFFEKGVDISQQKDKLNLPDDLVDFWCNASSAILFKDIKYGQWGLEIFTLEESLRQTKTEKLNRPQDYHDADLVIGGFYGDSDLLVVSRDYKKYGEILISGPLDGRDNWDVVADSFQVFLERYLLAEGNKYWQTQ
jgi:hypothetical protein